MRSRWVRRVLVDGVYFGRKGGDDEVRRFWKEHCDGAGGEEAIARQRKCSRGL